MTTSTPQEIAAIVAAVRAAERQVYTTEDMKRIRNVKSDSTISYLIADGQIPTRDFPRGWAKKTVDDWLAAGMPRFPAKQGKKARVEA